MGITDTYQFALMTDDLVVRAPTPLPLLTSKNDSQVPTYELPTSVPVDIGFKVR